MEKKKEGEGKEKKKKVKKKKKEIGIRYGPYGVCVKVGGVRVVMNNKKMWE